MIKRHGFYKEIVDAGIFWIDVSFIVALFIQIQKHPKVLVFFIMHYRISDSSYN